ncbi:hypothetical protein HJG60_008874 [Phyllostomus discolor]|uniref:Uncharacterized protein n=1 Tax=Phyllostomus discolor TaxID=89673 RepID=A0A833YME6_9CHIR|nr:hypothetical protein HJG60_008874 [Phyllostomus discolor]
METGQLKSRVTAAAAARRALPSPLQRPVCCRGQSWVPSGAEMRATPCPPFTGQQEGYKGRLCSQAASQPGDGPEGPEQWWAPPAVQGVGLRPHPGRHSPVKGSEREHREQSGLGQSIREPECLAAQRGRAA